MYKNDVQPQQNVTHLIVFTNQEGNPDHKDQAKLIYSSFPDWVLKFNFANWLERTKVWYVYELETPYIIISLPLNTH